MLLDSKGCSIVILAGMPRGSGWEEAIIEAGELIKEAGRQCSFSQKKLHHRRESFPALAVGISFGGGWKVSTSSS